MKFLADFLNQAHTGEQAVVGRYPTEFAGLRVRVFFGHGMPAHVPWIAFLADDMAVNNGYYPNYLYYQENKKLVLVFGISEENQHHREWRADIVEGKPRVHQVIQNPHHYGDSYVYKIYDVREQNGVRQICYGDQQVSEEELEDDLEDDLREICQLYRESLGFEGGGNGGAGMGALPEQANAALQPSQLFDTENQMENFLIKNWETTPFCENYDLIYENGELKSKQFRADDVGHIDILVKDRTTGSYLVIELKRGQTSDATIGQVARYMGWVQENLNDDGVRGLIIAGDYDTRIRLACQVIPRLELFRYQVNFEFTTEI